MDQTSQSTTIDTIGDVGEEVLTQEIVSSTGPMAEPVSLTSSASSVLSDNDVNDDPEVVETEIRLSKETEVTELLPETLKANDSNHKADDNDDSSVMLHSEPSNVPQSKQDSNELTSQTATHLSPPRPNSPPQIIDYNPQLLLQYQQVMMQQQHFQQMQQMQQMQHQYNYQQYPSASFGPVRTPDRPKRTTIQLTLVQEEMQQKRFSMDDSNRESSKSSFFFRRSRRVRAASEQSVFSEPENNSDPSLPQSADTLQLKNRGNLSVSWYEGTSGIELHEHVKESLRRKLCLEPDMELIKLRILDESVSPHEEIVLSPCIPDGSKFLLRFEIRVPPKKDSINKPVSPINLEAFRNSLKPRAPHSPSAAPSPFPSTVDLQSLQHQIGALLNIDIGNNGSKDRASSHSSSRSASSDKLNRKTKAIDLPTLPDISTEGNKLKRREDEKIKNTSSIKLLDERSNSDAGKSEKGKDKKEVSNSLLKNEGKKKKNDDVIAQRLIELNELLLRNREDSGHFGTQRFYKSDQSRRQEKKQVVFVLANYFVLFISLIAISAEIHERAPQWVEWVQENVTSVQNCSADRDKLFECVSDGDFSGLIASFILWASKSVTTKQIFLFGFDSPKKLWTVVYESAVTAICWGTSYIFIRRGLNPDTRPNFLYKFWKDAIYGSLAGFNAAFMKAILKNMIPQEQVLDVFEHRQLKIVHFLAQLFKDKSD